MIDFSYLSDLIAVIIGIIALIPVLFRVKKCFNKYVEKRIIYIFLLLIVRFKEFITMLNDKTILESEIIPSYLMSTVKTVNNGVPIENFMHWGISSA